MKFKHNVIGPDFSTADIVTFTFGEADISLPVPQDPDSDHNSIYIAPHDQTNLPVEPNIHWSVHPFGFKVFEMLSASWSYHDEKSELRVAKENFDLKLIEIPDDLRHEIQPLNKCAFKDWLFKFFRMMAVRGDTSLLGTDTELSNMKANMMPLSKEDIELYRAEALDWPMLTIKPPYENDAEANAARDPDYFIYIPISEYLFLYIDHSISIMSRQGNAGSLPKSAILELKRDILKEILANIRVTYSPKILELIKEKNHLNS
jgi:hypothetical protein